MKPLEHLQHLRADTIRPYNEKGAPLRTRCRIGQRDGVVYDVNRVMARILYDQIL